MQKYAIQQIKTKQFVNLRFPAAQIGCTISPICQQTISPEELGSCCCLISCQVITELFKTQIPKFKHIWQYSV